MNILLAGLMGRYADRMLTLKRLGHTLLYCTMPAPMQRTLPDDFKDPTVLRFEFRPADAGAAVRRLCQDHQIHVVLCLKNVWDGSPELLVRMLDAGVTPIVRHYKEHFLQPTELEHRGLTETAGQIYINQESFEYFRRAYGVREDSAHILDTDLLPAKYMTDEFRPKLWETDGASHLLVAGGVSVTGGRNDIRELCLAMSRRGVHVHIYGRKYVGPNAEGIWSVDDEKARRAYEQLTRSGFVHLHDNIEPTQFTAAWSMYDAGLMHATARGTHDAPFQRMNHPNRVTPYLAAGLPLAQQVGGHDAMERRVTEHGIGFLYRDYDELADILDDRRGMHALTEQVVRKRHDFAFEARAEELVRILARYARC